MVDNLRGRRLLRRKFTSYIYHYNMYTYSLYIHANIIACEYTMCVTAQCASHTMSRRTYYNKRNFFLFFKINSLIKGAG